MRTAKIDNNHAIIRDALRKAGVEVNDMRFDIKTVSEANQREHWGAKLNRKKAQQRDFALMWKAAKVTVELPATVTFTRHSCKVLDSDNLAGALKHVRDALAREIGIDDGDERIRYEYKQVRIVKREYYFTVTISHGRQDSQPKQGLGDC